MVFKKQKVTADQIRKINERIYKYQKEGNTVQAKRWSSRLLNIEAQLRKTANSRLKRLRAAGLDLLTADRLKAWISQRYGKKRRYLGKPEDIRTAYTQALTSLAFLNQPESTTRGMNKNLDDIKEDYQKIGINFESRDQLKEYYRWRKERPVAEFFNMFPISPIDIASEAASIAVQMWVDSDEERDLLKEYIDAFNDWLRTKEDDEPQGITASTVLTRLYKRAEEKGYRRRRR